MLTTLEEILGFLAEHTPIIGAIVSAVQSGASKDDLIKAIQAVETAAADAQMQAAFPGEKPSA